MIGPRRSARRPKLGNRLIVDTEKRLVDGKGFGLFYTGVELIHKGESVFRDAATRSEAPDLVEGEEGWWCSSDDRRGNRWVSVYALVENKRPIWTYMNTPDKGRIANICMHKIYLGDNAFFVCVATTDIEPGQQLELYYPLVRPAEKLREVPKQKGGSCGYVSDEEPEAALGRQAASGSRDLPSAWDGMAVDGLDGSDVEFEAAGSAYGVEACGGSSGETTPQAMETGEKESGGSEESPDGGGPPQEQGGGGSPDGEKTAVRMAKRTATRTRIIKTMKGAADPMTNPIKFPPILTLKG